MEEAETKRRRTALRGRSTSVLPIIDVGSALEVEGARREVLRVERVAGVPGAFILKNALSAAECAKLKSQVIRLHDAVVSKEAVRKRERDREGCGVEKGIKMLPRRASQHHVPFHASPESMSSLCERLRPYLPQFAGPVPGSDAEASPLCVSCRGRASSLQSLQLATNQVGGTTR